MSRRFRLTREGRVFLGATLLVGVAAINTGNNLLYMLLGAMLAFIVLSGILAEIALRGLSLARRVPPGLHAGQETAITIIVRNQKRHLPSFNLAVRESFGPRRTLDPVHFVHLAPRATDEGSYRCVFPRRGRCRFRGFVVETTFPFGLFVKSREIDVPDAAIVYPRVDMPVELPALRGGGSGEGAMRRGIGEEFYGLREYRSGDDRRRIYWKGSARRRQLLVRETAQGAASSVELYVANVAPAGKRDPLFEATLDHAATLALKLFEAGYAVSLASFDEPLPADVGAEHARALLTRLALMRQLDPDEVRARRLAVQAAGPAAHERIVLETAAARAFRPTSPSTAVMLVEHSSLELLEQAGRPSIVAGAAPADADAVTLAPAPVGGS